MKYIKKYLFLFLLFLIPFNVCALSVTSGNAYLYNALGNQNVLPEYDNNYGQSGGNYTIDIMNPSSFSCLRGSTETGGYYGVTKQINITINTDSNLTAYQKYRLKIVFDGGNYITYTDYYGWGWHANRDLTNCTNTSNCSISWTPSNHFDNNPPYYSDIDIEFTPNTSTNNFVFTIGNRGNIRDFTMWNRLGSYDCVNFNYSSLENVGGGSVDLSGIEEKQNETNEKLDEVNSNIESIGDDLIDESAPSTSDIEDIFDDIPILLPGPISNLILLPITILTRIVNETEDYCEDISLNLPYSNDPVIFPCFKITDYIGDLDPFFTMVGVLFIFYQIAMLIISCWDSWTSLDSTFSSMYQPKHASSGEYKPKHGGGN